MAVLRACLTLEQIIECITFYVKANKWRSFECGMQTAVHDQLCVLQPRNSRETATKWSNKSNQPIESVYAGNQSSWRNKGKQQFENNLKITGLTAGIALATWGSWEIKRAPRKGGRGRWAQLWGKEGRNGKKWTREETATGKNIR